MYHDDETDDYDNDDDEDDDDIGMVMLMVVVHSYGGIATTVNASKQYNVCMVKNGEGDDQMNMINTGRVREHQSMPCFYQGLRSTLKSGGGG